MSGKPTVFPILPPRKTPVFRPFPKFVTPFQLRKNPELVQDFFLLVAGPRIARGPEGYEPSEILLLYPANARTIPQDAEKHYTKANSLNTAS